MALFKTQLLNTCQTEFNAHVVNGNKDCRAIGTVRFIGKLYRQDLIEASVLKWCMMVLMNTRTDEKLKYLCELLTEVGQKMENKTHDEEYDRKYYRDLTSFFQGMQLLIALDQRQSKISNQVRSMLMDVIELRKNNWISLRSDSNPKKIGQTQQGEMGKLNFLLLIFGFIHVARETFSRS